jgi:HK97 gp10 family phage protein
MGKGAGVVKKAAIANAKAIDRGSTPRMIWKNIAVQMSGPQGKRVKGIVMRVGVLGGARQRVNNIVNRRAGRVGQTYSVLGDSDNPGGDTWYWRFIEFGSSKMRARPFMLPALRANADRATDVIRAELERQIGKLASKAGP